MGYLDNTGLTYLWEKIKAYIAGLGFYTKPSTGIPASDIASGVIPTVPSNVSAFTNDAGYITGYTETDPTVPSWAKASTKPNYTASEVGALPDTTSIPTESTVTGWGFTKNIGTITSTGGTVAVNNIQVVSTLPASPDANTLYLIPES